MIRSIGTPRNMTNSAWCLRVCRPSDMPAAGSFRRPTPFSCLRKENCTVFGTHSRLLEFHVSGVLRTNFHELFERPSEQRILKLSTAQRQRFSSVCQKLAFERNAPGSLNAFAASAWLTLLLVNVTRWLTIDPGLFFAHGKGEIDPQCFELWQKIQRQVLRPTATGPMLFGLNPRHDSLRHRFRKVFGISPQGMFIRLRMNRAKELLRATNLSVKEIAHELGYSRQHDLTRAFHKYTGTSPSEWKMHLNGFEPKESLTA